MSTRTATTRQFSTRELDEQFADWLTRQEPVDVDETEVKERVAAELSQIGSMTVQEYTLWRKWNDVHTRFPGHVTNTLFGPQKQPKSEEHMRLIHRARNSIWVPNDPRDFLELEPELNYVKTDVPITSIDIWGTERIEIFENPDPLAEDWRVLRTFITSGEYGAPVGRALNYLVRDRASKHYLGLICVSSDFMDLAPRESAIGWTQLSRVTQGRLNNTATGSTIVPTQPFGFNYLGGKLCALLCLSREVAQRWEDRYGDVLVAITTTSLYGRDKPGGLSQYSNLKHWKELGFTSGSAPLQLTAENEAMLRHWMSVRYPRVYWEHFVAQDRSGKPFRRDAINRAYQFCYRKLGFKPAEFTSAHQRGVYLARLYENADDFLCGRISGEALRPAFDNSTAYLVELWKTKYAAKRVEKLLQDDRVSREILFYDGLVGASWEETRTRYLSQVGR